MEISDSKPICNMTNPEILNHLKEKYLLFTLYEPIIGVLSLTQLDLEAAAHAAQVWGAEIGCVVYKITVECPSLTRTQHFGNFLIYKGN